MGQGDLDGFGPQGDKLFHCGIHGSADTWLHAIHEVFLRHTDAQALEIPPDLGGEVLIGKFQRRGVMGIFARHGIEQDAAILNSRGEGANLVERGGKGDQAIARDATIGWLQSHAAAESRWLTNRSTCIRAECCEGCSGSNRCSGAAAGATGNAVEIPRIAGWMEGRILGRGAHRKLIHVHPSERNGAGSTKVGYGCGVVGSCVSIQNPGCRLKGLSSDTDGILDSDGNTSEWLGEICRSGLLLSCLQIMSNVGTDRSVCCCDALLKPFE